MPLTDKERTNLRFEAGRVFTPSAPIDQKELFAGRRSQVTRVVDVISQRGQHGIIFGERGVGKTSLSNVLGPKLEAVGKTVLAPHVTCSSNSTFASVWRSIFEKIVLSKQRDPTGFTGESQTVNIDLVGSLGDNPTPEKIGAMLTEIGALALLVIIVDEFDAMQDEASRRLFADTIKLLSDHAVRVTLILIGVAKDAESLIGKHESVERALVQIYLPRMSRVELVEIINRGLKSLGMSTQDEVKTRIANMSRGLPHFTHALSLHACREAIDRDDLAISLADVDAAVSKALDEAHASIKSAYGKAIYSPRKDNLYSQVLLACALAETSEMGFFSAADVREPMTRIMGKDYGIPNFIRHLYDFCLPDHGNVLEKEGTKHKMRFRFKSPLMQAHVVMRGVASKLVSATIFDDASSLPSSVVMPDQ